MVVFLDVIILENCIINYFLLHITSHTIKIMPKFYRLFISSVLGSLYVLTLVYPSINFLAGFGFKFLVALGMVAFAFKIRNIKVLLKSFIIFILYSMLLGGICIFFQFSGNTNFNYGIIYNFSYKKLLLSIILMYLVIDRIVVYIRDKKKVIKFIYDIEIELNKNSIKVKAFLDTGNELREPITNCPVIIIENSCFKCLDINKYQVFYIPYSLVDGSSGNLIGIKPKSVSVLMENGHCKRDAIIAFTDVKLSKDGDYQALLSRGLL